MARAQKLKIGEIIFDTLGGTCFIKMNKFEEENFEVGYMTNNSPWINPSGFWDEDLMHLAVISQGHFWTEAPFGYSGQNFNITANEDLIPQDHPWTEAPFSYSGQNLEIFNTTANESNNVQNILTEEMHDSIL